MSAFPSTAELLVQGADSRLTLDSASGANHYLCRPQPDADLLCLGSSTATTISAAGFAVADAMRKRMAAACQHNELASVCRSYTEVLRQELRDCLHLNKNIAIELAESGTDAHRLAVRSVYQANADRVLHVVMVAAAETGRGVPEALCPPGSGMVNTAIAIRDGGGDPLPAALVDAAVVVQVEQAIARGENVLLVMVDQSKSGCVAPSLDCALQLQQRFSEQLHLLLDGCQFRFSAATLNAYLQHGMMVAITGSKFLAGPSFSAALLLPNRDESAESSVAAPALLLRWQVALTSLQALSRLDGCELRALLQSCGQAIKQRLQVDPLFEPLAAADIVRPVTGNQTAVWDDLPTIFPFRLRTPQGQHASHADCMMIYKQLQQGNAPRLQLGRPIQAGLSGNGEMAGALRLCISAPMLIDAIKQQQQTAMISQCLQALDSVEDIFSFVR